MTVRYRAWRFLHPDFDAPEAASGLGISSLGGIATVSDHLAVRQALLLLLSHMPGERVLRPDYGSELSRLVFMPNDATTAGLAIHYVRKAVERWEPRVQLLQVDANANAQDASRLDIFLQYRMRPRGPQDQFTFSISLTGEEA